MRNRTLGLLIVLLTGMLFLAAGILVAADVPDQILIENQGYKKNKKGPVKFTHKKHHEVYKLACTECHHHYVNGKNVWKQGDPVKKCNACHDPLKKKGKAPKLQNAFHKNCKSCHKKMTKAGKKSGPFKKCNQCHEKKKKS